MNQARPDGPVTGTFVTSAGTAATSVDFTFTNVDFTIPQGQTSTTVNVPIIGDFLIESTETFSASLFSVVGADTSAAVGGRTAATGTILDDDTRFITIADPAPSIEGDTGTKNLAFTISVNQARPDGPVTGTFVTSAGTAATSVDFTFTNVDFTIPQGQTSTIVNVPIIGDTSIEPTETFTASLFNVIGADTTPASGARTTATGTILDDDSVTLSIADAQLPEGDSG